MEKIFSISLVDLPELVGLPQFGDGSAHALLVQQIVMTFDGAVDILDGAFAPVKCGPGGGAGQHTRYFRRTWFRPDRGDLILLGAVFTRASGALVDGYYELTIQGGPSCA